MMSGSRLILFISVIHNNRKRKSLISKKNQVQSVKIRVND